MHNVYRISNDRFKFLSPAPPNCSYYYNRSSVASSPIASSQFRSHKSKPCGNLCLSMYCNLPVFWNNGSVSIAVLSSFKSNIIGAFFRAL